MVPHLPEFHVSPGVSVADAATEFKARGRIRIREFLAAQAAERLHQCLLNEVPWKLAYDANGHPTVLDGGASEMTDIAHQQELTRAVLAQARKTFQYLYYSYPMVTAYLQGADPGLLLHRVLEWLNTPETLHCIRQITGITTLRKGDAQATLYRAGSFLTLHDDSGVNSERRRVAYVLNLTKHWRADWGGLLHFVDENDEVVESWLPGFNVLALFKVPVRHTVSYVAPFATQPRLAITGWFRDA